MGNIPIPQFQMITLSKLQWPKTLNRGKDIQHCKDLKESFDNDGFMGAIRVFPADENGYYKVVDSNHTVEALKDIFVSEPDIEAPCLVLWNKDESDAEEVQEAIMILNLMNKEWKLFDFVKSHSSTELKHRPNHKTMVEIRENMKKFNTMTKKSKGGITNGVVASMYTKDSRNHKLLREGKFELDPSDRPYTDYFINNYPSWIWQIGGKRFKAPFNRRFVHRMWQLADRWKTEKDGFKKWCNLFDFLCERIEISLSDKGWLLPDSDEHFEDYFKTTLKQFKKRYDI